MAVLPDVHVSGAQVSLPINPHGVYKVSSARPLTVRLTSSHFDLSLRLDTISVIEPVAPCGRLGMPSQSTSSLSGKRDCRSCLRKSLMLAGYKRERLTTIENEQAGNAAMCSAANGVLLEAFLWGHVHCRGCESRGDIASACCILKD